MSATLLGLASPGVRSARAEPPEAGELGLDPADAEEPSDAPPSEASAKPPGAESDPDPLAPEDKDSLVPSKPALPAEDSLPPIVLPKKKRPAPRRSEGESKSPNKKGEPSPEPTTRAELEHLPTLGKFREELELHAKANTAGDQATAGLHLDNLLRLHADLGLRNYYLASFVLMNEARDALSEKDTPNGLKLLAAAAKLSPDLAVVQWRLAEARLEHDTDIGGYLSSASGAVRAELRDFESRLSLMLIAVTIMMTALAFATLGFVLIQGAKYARYLGHDLSRLVPGVSGLQATLLGAFALVLPVVFRLGWLSCLVLWLAVLGLYQSKSERRAAGVVALGIAAIGALVYLRAPLILYGDSDVRAMYEAATRVDAVVAETRLEPETDRPDAMFLLGMRARARGDLASAEKWLRKAVEADPKNPAAKNNLGTVVYLMQKPDEATKLFDEASRVATRAEPVLNRASTLLDESKFDEADRAFQRAASFDPDLAAVYKSEKSSLPTASKLLDMPFDTDLLWARLAEGGDENQRQAVANQIMSTLDRGTPPFWSSGVALALALLLFLGSKARLTTSVPCTRCGEPTSQRSQEGHCKVCRKVFLELSLADPKLRDDKERQIRHHRRAQRWTERSLSFFAGGSDVLGDRPFLGFASMLLLALSASLAWLPEHVQLVSWGADAGPRLIRVGLAVALALCVTLLSIRRGFER